MLNQAKAPYQKATLPPSNQMQTQVKEGEISMRLTELEKTLSDAQYWIDEVVSRSHHVLVPLFSGEGCTGSEQPESIKSPMADRLDTILGLAGRLRDSIQRTADRINI